MPNRGLAPALPINGHSCLRCGVASPSPEHDWLTMPVITESANAVTKSLRPAKTIVVMLVEDDDSVRRVAGEILTTAGYTILQAKNGQEALLLAERKAAAISVLIADVIMPEMSGPDVAKRLLRLHPQLRTIFISGYPENVLRNRQVVPNASYLRKPFSVEALMRAVSKAAGT